MRQTSQQLAGIRQAQADIRASQDLLLVRTGQILEASRVPPAPPLSSYGRMKSLWDSLKEVLSGFALLHKAYVAWRAISLPAAGYTLARWAGWL